MTLSEALFFAAALGLCAFLFGLTIGLIAAAQVAETRDEPEAPLKNVPQPVREKTARLIKGGL